MEPGRNRRRRAIYDENAAMQRCIHDTLLEIRDELRKISAPPMLVGSTPISEEQVAEMKEAMQNAGPGRIISLPAQPRVWGAWCSRYRYWLTTSDGRLLSHPSERMAKANILHVGEGAVKWEVREIGPDGLPVERVTP